MTINQGECVSTARVFLRAPLAAGANAVLAASIFHFGVVSVSQVKDALAEAGYPVRGRM